MVIFTIHYAPTLPLLSPADANFTITGSGLDLNGICENCDRKAKDAYKVSASPPELIHAGWLHYCPIILRTAIHELFNEANSKTL